MLERESINEMLTMQNALNEMTNGVDWKSGKTVLGKVIDWRRCIYMETAELIDSYPWKHWKAVDAPIDIENARVELVDIWHFLLSLTLEGFDQSRAAELLSVALKTKTESSRDLSVIDQVKVHENLMAIALDHQPLSESYIAKLASAFFDSCRIVELSFNELHQVYMAKNVLNKFRQDHGYKEGTYIKEWNGKEDNVVMFELIAEMDTFSGDQLYVNLKETYRNLG